MSELIDTSLVGTVLGLLWVASTAGVPRRDLPAVSVLLGVALQCLVAYKVGSHVDYANMVLVGIGTGLMAAGFQPASVRTTQYAKAASAKVKGAVSKRPQVRFAAPINVAARAADPADPAAPAS